jgi:TetR/AcrR family transcriptional regulator
MKAKATPARRMGVEDSRTRLRLIEEAMKLVIKEGCSAVTARRLAEKLGLKRQIVHYYFSNVEELLIEVIRHHSAQFRDRLLQALQTNEPLRVIWDSSNNIAIPVLEFTVMSVRSKTVRKELTRHVEDVRGMETLAITRYLELRGIKPMVAPSVMATVISAISHSLALRRAVGVTDSHAEVEALVDGWMSAYATRGTLTTGE